MVDQRQVRLQNADFANEARCITRPLSHAGSSMRCSPCNAAVGIFLNGQRQPAKFAEKLHRQVAKVEILSHC